MRESKFIDQNHEKWARFDQMLRSPSAEKKDPEELRELYVQATDDLSYARTFYPNRIVRSFLNGLAQHVYHDLSKEKKFPWSRLWRFWREDLPRQIFDARRPLLLSLGAFLLAFLIGVVSCRIDPEFPRLILGDDYVDMTLENIRSGDPMKVYKERGAFGMSLGIAINNVFVAMLCWVFGAVWGLGTLFFVLFNGIMVGAFQYFFFEKGVGLESVLTIWIHGTLEISAIVIAGGAGLAMGGGLLFPGTLTRAQSFRLAAKRGLKIFIGLVPVFLLAAFFEGFLTRLTETPVPLRAAFILINLAFVLAYFVWFPWKKWRRGDFAAAEKEADLVPDDLALVSFSRIRSSGEIFAESFSILRKNGSVLGFSILAAAAAGTFFMFKMTTAAPADHLEAVQNGIEPMFAFFLNWPDTASMLRNDAVPLLPFFQAISLTVLAVLAFRSLEKEAPEVDSSFKTAIFDGLRLVGPVLTFVFLWSSMSSWNGRILTGGLFFLAFLWLAAAFFERKNPFAALPRAVSLASADFWKGWLLATLFSVMGFLAMLFLATQIFQQIFQLLLWNLAVDPDNANAYFQMAKTFVSMSIFFTLFVLMSLGSGLLFFSLREILEAPVLRSAVDEIGTGRVIRGLARE